MGNTLWVDGVRKIVTITEATDYAEGTRRTAVEQFEKLGGSVLTAESYSADVLDFRSQLTKLFNENPDALLLAAQGEFSGGTIIKQARELGYDGPIYSEIVPTGLEALSIAGDAATGLKAIVPNPDLNSAAGEEFLANFRARYGVVASLPWFQASAYDCPAPGNAIQAVLEGVDVLVAERKRVGVADAVGLDGVSGTHEPEARDLRGLVGDASDVLARQGHARRLPSGRSYSNGGVTYLLVTRRWSVPAVRFGGQEHHISDRDQ